MLGRREYYAPASQCKIPLDCYKWIVFSAALLKGETEKVRSSIMSLQALLGKENFKKHLNSFYEMISTGYPEYKMRLRSALSSSNQKENKTIPLMDLPDEFLAYDTSKQGWSLLKWVRTVEMENLEREKIIKILIDAGAKDEIFLTRTNSPSVNSSRYFGKALNSKQPITIKLTSPQGKSSLCWFRRG